MVWHPPFPQNREIIRGSNLKSDVVIRAEALGKKYLIGHQAKQERYTALRDVLARAAKGLTRSASDMIRGRQLVSGDEVEEFWALKDVNFEIRRGEVVGIIGPNGAGKSTLLKVLSRITEPSEGRVAIKGRVASLLEVGTGFHPELTGRENIYLNGAILGMRRAEIKRKFDEIVDFAGVEKFLDTPVKRYSSGMYVRLAFAVAAHLEPEILIVDEVLAVGDAEFQKKCLGKMQDVAGSGRTVLFVSHNTAAVSRLCEKALLLNSGSVERFADVPTVLTHYHRSGSRALSSVDLSSSSAKSRSTSEGIKFTFFEIADKNGVGIGEIPFKEPFRVRFGLECSISSEDVLVGFSFLSRDGREIIGTSAHDSGNITNLRPGYYNLTVRIDPNILNPGTYGLRAAIFKSSSLYHYIDELLSFCVAESAAGADAEPFRHLVGDVHVVYPWDIRTVSSPRALE